MRGRCLRKSFWARLTIARRLLLPYQDDLWLSGCEGATEVIGAHPDVAALKLTWSDYQAHCRPLVDITGIGPSVA